MVSVVLISAAASMRDLKGGNYSKATPGMFRKGGVHLALNEEDWSISALLEPLYTQLCSSVVSGVASSIDYRGCSICSISIMHPLYAACHRFP